MKVILKSDIKALGKKESMVNVNDGYARNYLIPRGLAVEANQSNMSLMKSKADAESNRKDKEIEHAKKLASVLRDSVVEIRMKAGEKGRLFGSITTRDIADSILRSHNIVLDKRKIILDEAIKTIGEYRISIRLYTDIEASCIIKVIGE